MLADSLEHAFEDMNDRAFTEAKLKAGEMLPAVRIALEQIGGELSAEERQTIASRVAEVESAIAEGLRVVREEKRCAVLDMWLAKL